MTEFRQRKTEKRGVGVHVSEIFTAIREMPLTMRQLAPVQLLTWLGLFCMWLYFPVAVARNVFGAADQTSPLYTSGRGVGRHLFWDVLGGMFWIFFFLPTLAKSVDASGHIACHCSAVRLAWFR